MTLNLNHPWPPLVLSWLILFMILCGGCATGEYHQREYRGTWWCVGFCGRVVKDETQQIKGGATAPDPWEVDPDSGESKFLPSQASPTLPEGPPQ